MTYIRLNTRRNGSGKRFITRGSNQSGGAQGNAAMGARRTNLNSDLVDELPGDLDAVGNLHAAHAPSVPREAPREPDNSKPGPIITFKRDMQRRRRG